MKLYTLLLYTWAEWCELFILSYLKGKSCLLALGNINNVVASGFLLENDGLQSTVHGIPLGDDNVRVSIDVAIVDVA